MDDLFASLIGAMRLPTSVVLGLVLALAVASLFAGRWPAWAGVLLSAARAGAWAALRRKKPEIEVAKAGQKAEPAPVALSEPPPSTFSDNVATGISDEDRPPG